MSVLEITFINLLRPMRATFLASGGAALAVLGAKGLVKHVNLYSLFFFMVVGLAVYIVLTWASNRILKSDGIGILELIKSQG
jgi:hypothetical protein